MAIQMNWDQPIDPMNYGAAPVATPTINMPTWSNPLSGTQYQLQSPNVSFGGLGVDSPMQLDSGMFSVMNQPAATPSWMANLGDFASKNKDLITGGVGLAQAGLGAFNAWNTNQTAKDQLKFQKESFSKQYEAQKGLTNSQLSDRQRARTAGSGAGRYESVDSYMNKYGVK